MNPHFLKCAPLLFSLLFIARDGRTDTTSPSPSPMQGIRRVLPAVRDSKPDEAEWIALCRKDEAISKELKAIQKVNNQQDESVYVLPLAPDCKGGGCSERVVVAFVYRSSGVGTMGRSVLAMVSCKTATGGASGLGPCKVSRVEMVPKKG